MRVGVQIHQTIFAKSLRKGDRVQKLQLSCFTLVNTDAPLFPFAQQGIKYMKPKFNNPLCKHSTYYCALIKLKLSSISLMCQISI